MEKIHVLILIMVMDRAGAETMMMNYLRNIDRDKIQMDFMINRAERADYENEIESLGSKVYHISPLYPGKAGVYKREFREFLTEHPEYRIIHSHLEERSYYAMKMARKMGVPVRIVHAHSVPVRKDWKQIARLYLRRRLRGTYTHRFACSKAPAEWLYGTTEGVEYMRNAVDTERFSYDEHMREKERRSLHIIKDTLVIGHIGRFIYEKNHTFILDIFKHVVEIHPDSVLLLVGGGKPEEEGRVKQEVKEKAAALGLKNKVKFLGVRNDVENIMQAMDLLLMPSISEGFPVTLIEAQSEGLRCLVSDVISNEVNVTGELQYMSLDQDSREWADKVLSFCGSELDRAEMNRKVKEAEYDIKENAEWLGEYYEKVLRESGAQ